MGILVLILFFGLLVAFKRVKNEHIRPFIGIALLLAGVCLVVLLLVFIWMMSVDGWVTD